MRNNIYSTKALISLAAAVFIYLGYIFGATSILKNIFSEDVFKENYKNPSNIIFHVGKKYNLVLIYIESLEETYTDKEIFGRNILSSLDALQPPENGSKIKFPRMHQNTGTSWTIAGMIATQCAIPLHPILIKDKEKEKDASYSILNDQGEKLSNFLPKAKCLGDILKEHGYHNVFMQGGSTVFSGMNNFYQSHGYQEIFGMEYWFNNTRNKFSWGLSDTDLLAKSVAKFDALSKTKQPFNLTIATVDTHGPFGSLSAECERDGYKEFTGIVSCAADKTALFINHIQNSPIGKNTVVVVMGDHLATSNPVIEQLKQHKQRFVYNLILTPEKVNAQTEDVSRFDVLPTILAAMGWRSSEEKIGLGRNTLSPLITNDSSWQYKIEEISSNKSTSYLDLWRK